MHKKTITIFVCLHTHNMINKDRVKYLYEETARSLSLLELKDTKLKHYNDIQYTKTTAHEKSKRIFNHTKPNRKQSLIS